MITKAEILAIDPSTNYCTVSMPLFQNASSTAPIKSEALINIPPGWFNNLFKGDIVFVGFEENALEKPVILGKLYRGSAYETVTPGGSGILDSLLVRTAATIPATTLYNFQPMGVYTELCTPKKVADYILWLEELVKKFVNHLDANFRCFKKWVTWHFQPENIKIDDGDLGAADYKMKYEQQQEMDKQGKCLICSNDCLNLKKDKKLEYPSPDITITYPNK